LQPPPVLAIGLYLAAIGAWDHRTTSEGHLLVRVDPTPKAPK
jgi:hypothetical protein